MRSINSRPKTPMKINPQQAIIDIVKRNLKNNGLKIKIIKIRHMIQSKCKKKVNKLLFWSNLQDQFKIKLNQKKKRNYRN